MREQRSRVDRRAAAGAGRGRRTAPDHDRALARQLVPRAGRTVRATWFESNRAACSARRGPTSSSSCRRSVGSGFPVAAVRWLEPTGSRPRPAVLRDGLRRGRRGSRRKDRRWPPSWPSTSSAASMSCTASTGTRCSTVAAPARRPTSRSSGGRTSTGRRRRGADPPARGRRRLAAPPRAALERVGIVHGDPGPGNFVHDGRQVLAFTDWEFSHLGDPTEDWSFLLSMRGSRTMPRRTGWR